mmetsp:Transcript_58869/g.170802  ORF Transcript_58869/g.170802 Transcript_58869/m.170802 type:complete len:132 (-) Transcript_58869:17-412(-)
MALFIATPSTPVLRVARKLLLLCVLVQEASADDVISRIAEVPSSEIFTRRLKAASGTPDSTDGTGSADATTVNPTATALKASDYQGPGDTFGKVALGVSIGIFCTLSCTIGIADRVIQKRKDSEVAAADPQ